MVLEGFGRVWEGLEGVGRGGKGWEEVDGPLQHPKTRPSVCRPSAVRQPSVRPSVLLLPQWKGVCDSTTPQTPSNSAASWNVDACPILPQPIFTRCGNLGNNIEIGAEGGKQLVKFSLI